MKIKHWITAAFLILILGVEAQPVKQYGQLSVKGNQLVSDKGEAVMLAGVSYGWHNWWPRFYNKSTVKWLAEDWHCDLVRAAMGVGPRGSYTDKPEWSTQLISEVIEGALENDLYVIIDWHSHELKTEEARRFFSDMAAKYGQHPHIIYEIFNEPVKDSWSDVKAYSIEIIKAIREKDPDNLILVGSPHWCQDLHLVADDPIVGYDNLMYTVHFYAATHKQSLRDRCNYALAKGIPLFVSESAGMEASGNGPIDHQEWQTWIDWMKSHQISWVTWSIADKNETCSMLKPEAASEGGWSEDQMKESGVKTRALLRAFRAE
ncbi:MAG: glycoside hydrolase family 5 protein [Prolixibacteraceae bacterium]|jgi:endoglucanase|nr:glycoside hydrolase family 5 protein [Prolixibacteraceae bacterium]NLX28505.1 glycoside hydrolase family 5 protein [Bacteroidales bacterium]HPJ78138.1 glycoside hydrolase family 5 protein [Prolixibacteraceae bacterium]HRV87911.1 glycoside hydrolase family 5 protein [Prolixibacteraceae bacterium]